MHLLDSNIFIEAKNSHYRFTTFPGFWEWLDIEQARGNLASITKVYQELAGGNDELAEWVRARNRPEWFQRIDDAATQQKFSEIADWVMAQPFRSAAKTEFLRGADPWLIARSAVTEGTVVTQEVYDGLCRKRVPIPNVCRAMGVSVINTYELFERLGARFQMHGGS